jgi:hypothetical protein
MAIDEDVGGSQFAGKQHLGQGKFSKVEETGKLRSFLIWKWSRGSESFLSFPRDQLQITREREFSLVPS